MIRPSLILLLAVLPYIVLCLTPLQDKQCQSVYAKASRIVRNKCLFQRYGSCSGRRHGGRRSGGRSGGRSGTSDAIDNRQNNQAGSNTPNLPDTPNNAGTGNTVIDIGNLTPAAAAAVAARNAATAQAAAAVAANTAATETANAEAANAAAAAAAAAAVAAAAAAEEAAAIAAANPDDPEAVANATAAAAVAAEAAALAASTAADAAASNAAAAAAAAAAVAAAAAAAEAAVTAENAAAAAADAAADAAAAAAAAAAAVAAAANDTLVNGEAAEVLPDNQLAIAETGLVFVVTGRLIQQLLDDGAITAENLLPAVQPPLELVENCPFVEALTCDVAAPYRSADGSCNNIQFPYLGRSNTPFDRYLPAVYEDDLSAPRATGVNGGNLPGARLVSTTFHGASTEENVNPDFTHLKSMFGVFLNHDLQDYPAMPTSGDCCETDDIDICFPIAIPEDDPFFAQYSRTCMAYTRSLATPPLSCALGPREQLNGATSYIDASQVYGSDLTRQTTLRTMTGGLMRTTPTDDLDLLPQSNTTFCLASEGNLCFIGGDNRVNVQPMMMSQHTLFLREHNRVANMLSTGHPDWTDEIVFQEARKIVISEMQHIAYDEYLPKVLGPEIMNTYNLNSLTEGYSLYIGNINPAVRNGFGAAGIIYSHSGIRGLVTIGETQNALSSLFYNADVFYGETDAPTSVYRGLISDLAQEVDRLMSEELTNRLVETAPGNGWDLAALNIQQGRDNGIPTYTAWRQWCGLSVPENFTDLVDHTEENQNLLSQLYESVADIDVWSGGVSETPVAGGGVGPTLACITARQFQALKVGDRFWYENAGPNQLSLDTLAAVRNVTMSRLICDNTNIEQIQADAFLRISDTNPLVDCDSLPAADVCALVRSYGAWSAWTACADGQMSRTRTCAAPVDGPCSCDGVAVETQVQVCRNRGQQ